jgi:hypothetical protein
VVFIASCIEEAIGGEIQWFIIEEWATLGTHILEFQGYIHLFDGILIKIHKP